MWDINTFTDMGSFAGAANNFTGGWFWSLMLTALTFIIFLTTKLKTTNDRAFATAGFGSWIIGTFMFYAGWISWMIYSATIFLLVGGVISLIVAQGRET